MLPTVSKGRTPSTMVRSNLPQYLRRIVKWQQMDIEYTFWQMLHLCTSPKVVNACIYDESHSNIEKEKLKWLAGIQEVSFLSKASMNNNQEELRIIYCLRVYTHPRKAPNIISCFWKLPCVNEVKINTDGAPKVCCYFFACINKLCNAATSIPNTTNVKTKNQWARDDPAFVVICSLLLIVATSAYCAAYDHSVAHTVFTVISVLFIHFLVTGVILATCCW
ncbi:hypothetical protein GIB67_021918 [Kingdonia uniflora]|uniref:Uncharacterized protein n=1 Tax=Kingdonia uniflora TaxID=39325 RepID=A0A7J7N4E2_9MAGN|nr:hypothetical protein GIB67_021918 [Kingdonia uniflora]